MDINFKHEELFYSADLDLKDGLFEIAVSKLEEILQEDPCFGKAYNHLGWLYETKFKDFKTAERYYKLAIENMPEYAASYTNYAILLSTLRRFDDLEKHLEKASQVAAINAADLHNEYGIMYENQGKYDKAIESYKACAKATMNKNTLNLALDAIDRCKLKQTL